jgi:hypothetical protein
MCSTLPLGSVQCCTSTMEHGNNATSHPRTSDCFGCSEHNFCQKEEHGNNATSHPRTSDCSGCIIVHFPALTAEEHTAVQAFQSDVQTQMAEKAAAAANTRDCDRNAREEYVRSMCKATGDSLASLMGGLMPPR